MRGVIVRHHKDDIRTLGLFFFLDEALAAADEIGLPVLMRPSYVLGGQNMIVAYTKADVIEYMGVITSQVDKANDIILKSL